MSGLLKDIYSKSFFDSLCQISSEYIESFDDKTLKKLTNAQAFQSLELKQRCSFVADFFGEQLPKDFKKASKILVQIGKTYHVNHSNQSTLALLFIPEVIEKKGINDPATSLAAFEQITPIITCEFAIRPFIKQYKEIVLQKAMEWSLHPNEHIRRLSSEGIRPRLPWAMALPAFKENPKPILKVLENLKEDESEYVRRSVANNLNDISKDHPDVVLSLVKKWKGISPKTDALLKHGCRTMLKSSNREVLSIFDYGKPDVIHLNQMELKSITVKMNEHIDFEFQFRNASKKDIKTRIEYAIYFKKANGSLSKKVFKISERNIEAGSEHSLRKKHHIKPITTRKYHPGTHAISLIINGVESDRKSFELVF